jgi:hypothetical protein
LVVSDDVVHRVTTEASNSAPKYLPQRNKNEGMCINVVVVSSFQIKKHAP